MQWLLIGRTMFAFRVLRVLSVCITYTILDSNKKIGTCVNLWCI
jgi:hypothetical protein